MPGFWDALKPCNNVQALQLFLSHEEFTFSRDQANLTRVMGSFPTFVLPYISRTVRNITLAFGPDENWKFLESLVEWVNWHELEENLQTFPNCIPAFGTSSNSAGNLIP